jgi:hypothetical protein
VSEANRYSAAFGRFLAASRSAWMRATASSTCRDGAAGVRGEDREAAAAASSAKLRMVGSGVYRLPLCVLGRSLRNANRAQSGAAGFRHAASSTDPLSPTKVIALAARHP